MSARPLGFGIWGAGMFAEFHERALAEIWSVQPVASIRAGRSAACR